MFGIGKYTLAALVVGAGLFATGCQSSGTKGQPQATSVAAAADQAVTCEKCQITWVKSPVANQKGRVIAYTTKASHECPDCRAAVNNFFATGKMEHACATCGEALQVCEAHPR